MHGHWSKDPCHDPGIDLSISNPPDRPFWSDHTIVSWLVNCSVYPTPMSNTPHPSQLRTHSGHYYDRLNLFGLTVPICYKMNAIPTR